MVKKDNSDKKNAIALFQHVNPRWRPAESHITEIMISPVLIVI